MRERFALVGRPASATARKGRRLRVGVMVAAQLVLLCGLMIFLNACKGGGSIGIANPFTVPSKSGATQTVVPTPSPSPHQYVTPLPTQPPPNITLSMANCPSTLSVNWDSLVGTKAKVNKVQTVTCGSLEGSGSFVALVAARYYTPDAKLDVYVYDNLSGAPYRRFALQGLLGGDAQISPTGTLLTAEVGPADVFKGAPDIFREYSWNGSSFTQVYFPGMFPDMTHYQAEKSQALVTKEVAQGKQTDTWRNSFFAVAQNMALQVFHWTSISAVQVTYQPGAGVYVAQVNNLGPGGGGFVATFTRLDNVSTNIFEVTKVTAVDGYTTITNPAPGAQLTNPITLSGNAQSYGSVLGRVLVYSDAFVTVGDSGAIPSSVSSGITGFTWSVKYNLNASSGVQEGAVAFFATSLNNIYVTNQVTVIKVLLTA